MMNITECSKQLQALTKAHANYTISLEDYHRERKILLDELDHNINGIAMKEIQLQQSGETSVESTISSTNAIQESEDQQDKTQPYFAKKIDKCMSFIKGSNN